jgi:hypothetical protein
MSLRLLVLDNSKDMAKYHFDQWVRPKLQMELLVDLAKDAETAEAMLRDTQYDVAIVEAYIQPKPLSIRTTTTKGSDREAGGFWSSLFGRKKQPPETVSIEGLTGRSVADLIRSAAEFLPTYATIRPSLKFIVVSHDRGGLSKETKARLTSCPNVLGLFGWLSTEANAKKVARLISECGP